MSWADDALTRDAFLGGDLQIFQPQNGYRAGTDPVLLAAAVDARPGQSALELGCGAGTGLLCLGRRVAGLRLDGLEQQAEYAALARRNAAENGLEVEVFDGDLSQPPAALKERSYDHVFANPPFFAPHSGKQADDAGREAGRRALTPVAAWVDAATRRLRPGGHMTMIHRAADLPALIQALDARMGSLVILPLTSRAGRAAGRVILRAKKGGRAEAQLLAPFILHDGSHGDGGNKFSTAAERILKFGGKLSL